MATRIIEFDRSFRGDALPAIPPALVVQAPLTASGTPQATQAMSTKTTMLLIQSDEIVHFGRNAPGLTTSYYKIPAGTEQFFHVYPGDVGYIMLGS